MMWQGVTQKVEGVRVCEGGVFEFDDDALSLCIFVNGLFETAWFFL